MFSLVRVMNTPVMMGNNKEGKVSAYINHIFDQEDTAGNVDISTHRIHNFNLMSMDSSEGTLHS